MIPAGSATARSSIKNELHRIILEIGEEIPANFPDDLPILDLGVSSMALVEGMRRIYDRFGVLVSIRRVIEGQISLDGLALYIEHELGNQQPAPASKTNTQPPPPKWNGAREVVLSPAQQHIGFLSRYSSEASAAFNEPLLVRLEGTLDGPALQAAVEGAAEAFEALHTALDRDRDLLIVGLGTPLELTVSPAASEMLSARLSEICAKPFELGTRLFRAELLRISETEHVLALVGHRLLLDQHALVVILEHIAECYGRFNRDESDCLAPPVLQWTDYLAMSETTEAKTLQQVAESWWTEIFTSGVPRAELPSDHPRPAIKNYAGARRVIPLEAELDERLREVAEVEGFSPENVLFAAFSAYLHFLSESSELVVGLESEPVYPDIGLPAIASTRTMLPILSSFDPSWSFADHIRLQAERIAMAQNRRHISLSELIQSLHLARDQSRSALFTFAFHSRSQSPAPSFANLEAAYVVPPSPGARYDLELEYVSSENGAWLVCDYSSELFEPASISSWLGGMQAWLSSGLREPKTPTGFLEKIHPAQRERLLFEWNNTEILLPQDQTALDLILEQALKMGDRAAIRFDETTLTYNQMLERIDQFAAALHKQGVKRGDRVGVMLKRSIELIPAMLAAWRLGAAYVPMDAGFPALRLAMIMQDADLKLLVSSRELLERIEVPPSTYALCIEDLTHDDTSDLVHVIPARKSDNAIIFFTSGSTGRPKGAEIRHSALLNVLLATKEYLEFTPLSTMLALTTITFDISTAELIMPLLAGGCVEVGEDGLVADGSRIAEHIRRRRPSHVQATPSTWKYVITASWEGDPDMVLFTAGEALSRQLAEDLLVRCRSLWNLYGPTETTVYSTASQVQSAPGDTVRIGRPFPNTRLYILDRFLQPVPIGALGELYIGGEGLSNGYWRRPDLTAERFLPDPFRSGERMYRTGDLARYLPGGEVVYLGRSDDLVKIHGVRVEPREVEITLLKMAGIRDAVVVPWKDPQGDLQLVGHVIAEGDPAPTLSEIRSYLLLHLPLSMIPVHILFTDQFPLTPNGKIHRSSLPSPLESQPPPIGEQEAPATPTEKSLASVWASLLQIDAGSIGRDSDFLELGGHSLLMTQLMIAVRRQFDVSFNLRDFFSASALRKFAGLIDEQRLKGNGRKNGRNHSIATFTASRRGEWARQRMAFLEREAQLPLSITPGRGLAYQADQPYRKVLLTGATGFLGAYLVAEVLNTTSTDLICLVRPKRGESGLERIEKQLRRYELWKEDDAWRAKWSRLKVVEGDVTLPRLGLPDGTYESMAREIDATFHGAAHVNFIYPYEALRATNILGLHEIIRFSFHSKIKPVHHISTAAIWPMGAGQVYFEKDPIEHYGLLNLGYDEAKWVAEKSLLQASERGLPAARYRPGEVGGDSLTGRCVVDHFIIAAFKGFLQFGAFPALDIEVDIAPVDYVARAMVFLAFHGDPLGRAFHLTNPRRIRMIEALAFLRKLGYQFEELAFEALRNRLVSSSDFAHNALFAFQTTLEDMDDVSMQLPTYDTRETQRQLASSGIECPPADEKLFETYLRYLQEIGFIPQPEALVEGI